jgi:hypothetical protein
MRADIRPGGGFKPEPGDMVRIGHPGEWDGVWAEVEVGEATEEKKPSWIPAGPRAVGMYLGETEEQSPDSRRSQVLHGGRILNVRTEFLQPER